MPRIAPVPAAEAADKVAQTYERLQELFGDAPIPEPFRLYARVPAFLSDFYMNFKKFCLGDGKLDAKTKAVIGLAVAGNAGCEPWADYFAARAKSLGADDQTVADTAAVASACTMYNIFFKFRDLSGSDLFSGMAVGLRAHTFAGTSLDDATVELINIAISDINGCKPCTEGHVTKARQLGVSDEALLETIQIAATVAAGTQFLKHAGT
ncbi:MAG TPA: carboxymuconolactone decarboxylase family protein [Planctomycetaceae bacterium]|nr:carboxymuconolactone decarboxylase family protein [Planctomycetaceae bacterium]